MKTENKTIKTNRSHALATGVCFILAAVTSIIGKLLYQPVLLNPDYLNLDLASTNQVTLGAVFELILACTAIGTAIGMYPYLRKFNESLGLGYVIFRTLEVVFILLGMMGVLALIKLSQTYTSSTNQTIENYQIIGQTLKGIHDWSFILGPNFMLGVNTFMYSYVFFTSGLLPKKIAILGISAAILIFTASLLELFGVIQQVSTIGFLLAVPVFFYEMTVAVWLIRKGFDLTSLDKKY
jgi:hypothetical protein